MSVNGKELIYYWCPPGYCQCVHLNDVNDECSYVFFDDDNDDNRQCVCDRKGIGKNKSITICVCVCVHEI